MCRAITKYYYSCLNRKTFSKSTLRTTTSAADWYLDVHKIYEAVNLNIKGGGGGGAVTSCLGDRRSATAERIATDARCSRVEIWVYI